MSHLPKLNTTQDSSIERQSLAEPVPDWSVAKEAWQWAWPLHHYGFGLGFLGVSLYGIFLLIKLWRNPTRKARNYFACIAVLTSVFGLLRATVLLLDPYTSHTSVKFPSPLGLLMFSLGYPCLTSGFFLINWSLIEVTRLKLLPTRLHQRKFLVIVLTVHFTVAISFDVLFVSFPGTYLFLMICRSFFVFWGILLFGGFVVAGLRIQREVKKNMATLTISHSSSERPTYQTTSAGVVVIANKMSDVTEIQKARTMKVMAIARRAALTGLLICCGQIYATYEFYVFYNDDVQPKPWPWWIYQTGFRLTELFMVSQMLRIIHPPK